MLNNDYSSISFRAKFDSKASQRLLDCVNHCHGLKMGVNARMSHICEWGDSDSVILLKKDTNTSTEKFVLKNDKFSDKEVVISKPISNVCNSIVMAFLGITKKVILEAENILING